VTAGRGRLELGTRSSIGKADIAKSTVNVTIDVATVDTGVSQRDADLKSDHFFDVEKLPTATFVSKTVSKSPNGLIVSGDLTVRGMTKPVVLQVEGPNGPVNGSQTPFRILGNHNHQPTGLPNRNELPSGCVGQ
jgi:polyisoprenoid-binding protein YceI